jgi:hypothetical protein
MLPIMSAASGRLLKRRSGSTAAAWDTVKGMFVTYRPAVPEVVINCGDAHVAHGRDPARVFETHDAASSVGLAVFHTGKRERRGNPDIDCICEQSSIDVATCSARARELNYDARAAQPHDL